MSSVAASAQACAVSTCAYLTTIGTEADDFEMWLSILQELLPDCEPCPQPMVTLLTRADQLAFSQKGRGRDNALSRLRYEVKSYFALAAGARLEAYRAAKHGGQL